MNYMYFQVDNFNFKSNFDCSTSPDGKVWIYPLHPITSSPIPRRDFYGNDCTNPDEDTRFPWSDPYHLGPADPLLASLASYCSHLCGRSHLMSGLSLGELAETHGQAFLNAAYDCMPWSSEEKHLYTDIFYDLASRMQNYYPDTFRPEDYIAIAGFVDLDDSDYLTEENHILAIRYDLLACWLVYLEKNGISHFPLIQRRSTPEA